MGILPRHLSATGLVTLVESVCSRPHHKISTGIGQLRKYRRRLDSLNLPTSVTSHLCMENMCLDHITCSHSMKGSIHGQEVNCARLDSQFTTESNSSKTVLHESSKVDCSQNLATSSRFLLAMQFSRTAAAQASRR